MNARKICISFLAILPLVALCIRHGIAAQETNGSKKRSAKLRSNPTQRTDSQAIGMVLSWSGSWYLKAGSQKIAVDRQGIWIYPGFIPIRTGKDGTLVVALFNDTLETCPGNHKISEPYELSVEDNSDEWWKNSARLLSDYGSWIFPALRGEQKVWLDDSIIGLSGSQNQLDLKDAIAALPDGDYKFALRRYVDKSALGPAVSFKLNVRDHQASAVGLASPIRPGTYELRITDAISPARVVSSQLTKSPESDIGDISGSTALIALVDETGYAALKGRYELAVAHSNRWEAESSDKRNFLRAYLFALSRSDAGNVSR